LEFSIDKPESLESIKNRWYPEVSHYVPEAAYVLCANKIDLRDNTESIQMLTDKGLSLVTKEEGENMAKLLKIPYLECSSLYKKGLHEVIETATITAIEKLRNPSVRGQKKGCVML